MPQVLLAITPAGSSSLGSLLSVCNTNGEWTYHLGIAVIGRHTEDDLASFRLMTGQFVAEGLCTQGDVVRAFGVSLSSVKRSVKSYRTQGARAFFLPRKSRGGTVLTAAVRLRAQALLDSGNSRKEVCVQLGIKPDCLRKGIESGRLIAHVRASEASSQPSCAPVEAIAVEGSAAFLSAASDASQRAACDAQADMGMACTHALERIMAAMGQLAGAPIRFEACRDVPNGGVLTALPALMVNGLLSHLQECFGHFQEKYYSLYSVVVLVACMALCRIKHLERLRFESPGEWGKLMGLDRIPEVRTLRGILKKVCLEPHVTQWADLLRRDWLHAYPETVGVLYLDGHVRVYHGDKTPLPRRYVSRERLCMRGVTDYYINDVLGRPVFVVEKQIDDGLIQTLKNDVIPQLLRDIPNQPTEEQLKTNPHLCRFTMVFDREGYSPRLFKQLWQEHRIACITYHKFPKTTWDKEEFMPHRVEMPNGEIVEMLLAERGTRIGSAEEALWVREVRKLTESGHQTSLISTAFQSDGPRDAAFMFNRWVQENFFAYMKQNYAIDALDECGVEEFPDPKRVVNPEYRRLESQRRSLQNKLDRKYAEIKASELNPSEEDKKRQRQLREIAEIVEQAQLLKNDLDTVKKQIGETPHHIDIAELPEEQRILKLSSNTKRFITTIKLIAYRAETMMAMQLRPMLARTQDARPIICELMKQTADIYPDEQQGILHVHIHPPTTHRAQAAMQSLLEILNATETKYPGTNMTLQYHLIGNE